MPKRFGRTVCTLATLSIAISFVGCRTTTSKLAAVPGFGWLGADEEGWAQYEPAPGLPRPSLNAEPTSVDKADSPAASLAKKADAKSSSNASPFGNKLDPPSFSNSGSATRGLSNTSADRYGDYASAYGKYGTPTSRTESNTSTFEPQKGLYDVPKYTPSTPSSLANSSSKYGPLSAGDGSGKSTPGSSDYRFNNAAKSPSDGLATDSFRGSRYGDTQPTATPGFNKPDPYVPPGFVKSSIPKPANSFGANNGGQLTASSNARNLAADGSANSPSSGSAARGGLANMPSSKPLGRLNEQQPVNRYSTPAGSPSFASSNNSAAFGGPQDRFSAGASAPATNPTFNNAPSRQNSVANAGSRFSNPVTPPRSTAPTNGGVSSAGGGSGQFSQFATDNYNRFSNQVANTVQSAQQQAAGQIQSYAQQAQSKVESAVTSTYNNAKSSFENNVSSQYDAAQSRVGQFANSAQNAVQSRTREYQNAVTSSGAYQAAAQTANQYLQKADTAVRKSQALAQNYGVTGQASAQPAYPSTSTPQPYVIPERKPSATNFSNPVSPPTQQPAPTNGAVPSVQRSSAPYLPGSTSTFQGATQVRKPIIQQVSAQSSVNSTGYEPLAVGDRYQFPRTLR